MGAFALLPGCPEESPKMSGRQLFLMSIVYKTVDFGIITISLDEFKGVLVIGMQHHIYKGIIEGGLRAASGG